MKKSLIVVVALILVLTSFLLVGCKKETPLSLQYELDNSVKFLKGEAISQALASNSGRGLRYDFALTLSEESFRYSLAFPDRTVKAEEYIKEQKAVLGDNLTTCVATIYLSNYKTIDLTETALDELDNFLYFLKKQNCKVVLRFAYDTIKDSSIATKNVENHIMQIGKYFRESSSNVKNVMAFQVSFLGVNGTWKDIKPIPEYVALADKFVAEMPENSYFQVPTLQLKEKMVANHNSNRIGFYGVNYDEAKSITGKNSTSSKQYKRTVSNSLATYNDISIAPFVDNAKFNAEKLIQELNHFHATTLDISSNYSLKSDLMSVDKLLDSKLTIDSAKRLNIAVNPYWFENKAGVNDSRSAYEYLNDHLGYHMVVSNLKTSLVDDVRNNVAIKKGSVSFMITNFGTSAPLGYSAQLYFRNPATGETKTDKRWIADMWEARTLTTYNQTIFNLDSVEFNKGWQIGIKFFDPKNTSSTIRLANDIPYENGVNYFYKS